MRVLKAGGGRPRRDAEPLSAWRQPTPSASIAVVHRLAAGGLHESEIAAACDLTVGEVRVIRRQASTTTSAAG